MICLKQTLMDWKEDRSLDVYLKYKKESFIDLYTHVKKGSLRGGRNKMETLIFLY